MNFRELFRFGLAALTAVFLCAVAASPALAQEGKPNVVFILADNVGYGDLRQLCVELVATEIEFLLLPENLVASVIN